MQSPDVRTLLTRTQTELKRRTKATVLWVHRHLPAPLVNGALVLVILGVAAPDALSRTTKRTALRIHRRLPDGPANLALMGVFLGVYVTERFRQRALDDASPPPPSGRSGDPFGVSIKSPRKPRFIG